MLRTRLFRVLAACLPLLSGAVAAPDELDFRFAEAGLARDENSFSATSLLVRGDGRIVVAGRISVAGDVHPAVMQFLPDGQKDTSFSGDGITIQPFPGSGFSDTRARVVVEQPDGKLVVLSNDEETSMVTRYGVGGGLDASFGTSGRSNLTFPGLVLRARALRLLPDGKLLVLAGADGGVGAEQALVRLSANGALDTTFQGTGIVRTTHPSGFNPSALFVLGDGKIVTMGQASTTSDVIVVQYLADGTLDPMFGTGGISTKPLVSLLIASVERLDDGRLLVASRSGGNTLRVRRLLADGTLDSTFGAAGVAEAPFGRSVETTLVSLRSMAVQPDGKIVVVGRVLDDIFTQNSLPQLEHLAMARFAADGVLDESFGSGGTLRLDLGFIELGEAVAVQPDGKIVVAMKIDERFIELGQVNFDSSFLLARFFGGEGAVPPPPPVFDTTSAVTGEPDGTLFSQFGTPAVDGGQVGGLARIGSGPRPQTVIYGGDGSVQARTGEADPLGGQFIAIGDPVFAGEALGFAATATQPAGTLGPLLRLGFDARAFAVRPGGKLVALYSQLTRAAGIKRLAAQADPAPGGGQFAKFGGFGLPRTRGGLVFTGNLHRSGGVTAKSDFGVWREKTTGGDSDLLLRHGNPLSTSDARIVTKLSLMTPVTGASDQRRSFAPDGGVAAVAKLDDGASGVVHVAPDGSTELPLEMASAVPDEAGAASDGVEFVAFDPPATASGGRLALLAALKAGARGLPPPPSQAIFSNTGGIMRRVVARGEEVPGRNGVRWGALGQPLLGQRGMIGLIAALTGRRVTPANRQAIAMFDDDVRAVVARLGDAAPGAGSKATFRRFMSVVVTDSDPARLLFTATIGGPGVKASNNTGLWSVSKETGSSLILRKGGTIMVGGRPLTVRTFEALQAPKKNIGQGRSTDADGFVTAKAKLSDGRQGVLRIPLL